jgi:elongation factor G
MNDPFVGSLTFCRIYSGTLSNRSDGAEHGEREERARRPYAVDALQLREDIKEAYAGDIVAIAGLKDTTTGDTLCDPAQAGDPGAHGIP